MLASRAACAGRARAHDAPPLLGLSRLDGGLEAGGVDEVHQRIHHGLLEHVVRRRAVFAQQEAQLVQGVGLEAGLVSGICVFKPFFSALVIG